MSSSDPLNPKSTLSGIAAGVTGSSGADKPSTGQSKKNEAISQEQFLNLLVNQLQHQDPLDPMKSEEFAVQLATFSQLEQLVQINKKLGDGGEGGLGSVSSMASYLGYDVVLKGGSVDITGGKGPGVVVDVPPGTQSVRIDLMDDQGKVVGSKVLDDVTPGSQKFSMEGYSVADGTYAVQVKSVNAQGQFVDLASKVSGTVEGFVLDPEPALLVGGAQVKLEDIVEVHKAPPAAQ